MKHYLIIHSLHDAIADCSCGRWRYAATGERTREEVEKEYRFHSKDGNTLLAENALKAKGEN